MSSKVRIVLKISNIYNMEIHFLQIASMLSTKTFTLIIIIASLNRYHFCDAADVSDIRRLRIRAAMSDPIEESCKGSLDFNGFSKLDKICKDCFNLIREPEIYQLCR